MSIERRISGAGVHLALHEFGDASRPTIVLLHGFPDTSAVWNSLVALLSPDFHVVTYDVRGAGQSDAPTARAAYDLSMLVADLEAVLDAASPEAPVHLVAHDWGSIQGWEAVTTDRLSGRFASYTSISGPPLDYAALWSRNHRSWRNGDIWRALRQGLHSWYIAFFHVPVLPKLMTRGSFNRKFWAWGLHRTEGARVDESWPAPTLGADFGHGVELYRANVRARFRHPKAGHTDTPVQLIVPLRDRYVTPDLLDGLEAWATLLWRRPVEAGHWVVRTDPEGVDQWVREVIAYVEDGTESPALRAGRLSSPA
jgi:pimeloyl-ACP methyl ester carboxylesterase